VDFRNLNQVLLKDNYPLPKMDHILQRVVGAHIILMMDGFSGYNQIVVHKDDRDKTTFITPWGTSCMINSLWIDECHKFSKRNGHCLCR
jgi:hypothetical protein